MHTNQERETMCLKTVPKQRYGSLRGEFGESNGIPRGEGGADEFVNTVWCFGRKLSDVITETVRVFCNTIHDTKHTRICHECRIGLKR